MPATFPFEATQARQLLLLRAHEDGDAAPSAWTAADSEWVSAEALRVVGERGAPEAWLATRAELAQARLSARDPALAALATPTAVGGVGLLVATVLVALLLGLASNAVGPAQRIDLLAPPLLAVLVWNLAVYLMLAIGALLALRRRLSVAGSRAAPGIAPKPALDGPARPVSATGWATRLAHWLSARSMPFIDRQASPSLRRSARDWAGASLPLQTARLATAMHLGAAALAAGVVGGLYLRGLAFEFRAGWDSTFLGAATVHAWLSLLLAPAAALGSVALPGVAQIDALRWSRGPGENAARWIHLYAITTAVLVLLPRGLLAAASAWRAARLKRDFPLSLDTPYFQRLLQQLAHARQQVTGAATVLTYSYRLDDSRRAALASALAAELGPGLSLHWQPAVPLGGEDKLDLHWPPDPPGAAPSSAVVVLFALSATPERDTHGAFLRQVQARCATARPAPRCLVVLDDSGLRQRLSDADRDTRLAQRRTAWRSLLDDSGQQALFLNLGAP